jgi:hypothetical protein
MSFENILTNFSDYFAKLKDDKIVMLILIVLISLYAGLWVDTLQPYTVNIFTNKYFRFLIFVLITYITSGNPALGLILAIAVLITMQTITYTYINNNSERFSPFSSDNDNYLSRPLLQQKELRKMGDSVNFKLQTPTELYENMIKQGRVLLDDSLEMRNDLKTRFDVRELEIAKNTERNGRNLVQSGINRLQPANNGEYSSWLENSSVSSLSTQINEDRLLNNHRASYVKYDRHMQNFAENETVMDLFNLLKSKYNEIISNKSLSTEDFENKIQEIYDTELDLLVAIAEATVKNENTENINKKIEFIKSLRASKNPEFYNELTSLSSMLCSGK